MLRFNGRIELDRELTITRAKQLEEFFNTEHQGRKYTKPHLMISQDGRAIQWDGEETEYLEIAIADALKLFIEPWRIMAQGVIQVTGEKQYSIVVLKKMVKVYMENDLREVECSPDIRQI